MSLRVDNLRVYYRTLAGDVRALDGVTFQVADGEIMGLVGESGCGKSTLAKSLIRLDSRMRYVEGTVDLDGQKLPVDDQDRMREHRLVHVSIVPQYAMSALMPIRRVGRIIADLLESRGHAYRAVLPELERRLDMVGLPREVLRQYPIELSGGMKQRAVLLISTLLNPSLLIADEITSALDTLSQKAVAETLVQFRDRAFVSSMVVVTHDISLVYQIADTVLVMYAGKLAEKAPTNVIVEAPRHPYTRLLISSLPDVGMRYTDGQLRGIPGTPPQLLDPPVGCRFRGRCPLATHRCATEPPFVQVGPGHQVACWEVVPSC
jgi:peptide/nickel transport system ATP-binding protein